MHPQKEVWPLSVTNEEGGWVNYMVGMVVIMCQNPLSLVVDEISLMPNNDQYDAHYTFLSSSCRFHLFT